MFAGGAFHILLFVSCKSANQTNQRARVYLQLQIGLGPIPFRAITILAETGKTDFNRFSKMWRVDAMTDRGFLTESTAEAFSVISKMAVAN